MAAKETCSCVKEYPVQDAKSAIFGEGHGSRHRWVRGPTAQQPLIFVDGVWSTKPLDPDQRHTHYRCHSCGLEFIHFYDRVSNIFLAMQLADLPAQCTPPASSMDSDTKKK